MIWVPCSDHSKWPIWFHNRVRNKMYLYHASVRHWYNGSTQLWTRCNRNGQLFKSIRPCFYDYAVCYKPSQVKYQECSAAGTPGVGVASPHSFPGKGCIIASLMLLIFRITFSSRRPATSCFCTTPRQLFRCAWWLVLNALTLPLTLMITRQKSSINVGMYREDKPQVRGEQWESGWARGRHTSTSTTVDRPSTSCRHCTDCRGTSLHSSVGSWTGYRDVPPTHPLNEAPC